MQIGDEFIIIIIAAAAAYICGKGYIFLWSKKIGLTTTPSGFGVLLPVFVLTFMALILEGWATSLNGILIIFIAGLIYWLDDLVELLRFTRILLAFCCGVALVLVASPEQLFTSLELVVFSIACGVFLFGITQVINFADGADLNLAVMVFLSGIILIFFSDTSNTELQNVGSIMVGFSLGFGWINRVPFSLYLGDAGAFVLALLFTLFLINYVLELSYIPAELMSVLALPVFDVFYVLLIRLHCKHDLLSRNSLHLYQRIRIRFGGFLHLIPQFINVVMILFLADWVESTSATRFWALFLSSAVFTPIWYLSCRILMVERNYFFGDGESNQS
jgi:UDP-N-acetylmuramyl pentapeptide phosphotransferase/UDP-N-acetylglucosamine-1-phosphate transferase